MDLSLIRIFVKVVQYASFSKAAEGLKLPKSTVSKAISRLEDMTQTTLLLRTTRSLTLTPEGLTFYQTCLEPLQILEAAQKSLIGQERSLSGIVRITAPEDFAEILAPLVQKLTSIHPQLHIELHFSDQVVDLIKEGFDFAIRIGTLKESRLKARKLGMIDLITVASPSYLKKISPIKKPQDLQQHACLTLRLRTSFTHWIFKNKIETANIKIHPRVTSNQMTSLLQLAEAGTGVALIPRFLCKRSLANGSLLTILPAWRHVSVPVSLVSPLSSVASQRTKMISELLFNDIQKALSQ